MKILKTILGLTATALLGSSLMSFKPTNTYNAELRDYKIVVKISDNYFSGSDGNVKIILYGENGETNALNLDNDDDNFETGSYNEFHLKIADIGDIQQTQLIVEPNDDDMRIHYVSVDGICYYFDSEYTVDTVTPIAGRSGQYEFKVETRNSDKENAHTDNDVSISIYSGTESCAYQVLNNDGDDFEEGDYSTYYVVGVYEGVPDRVRITEAGGRGLTLSWLKIDGLTFYNNDEKPGENDRELRSATYYYYRDFYVGDYREIKAKVNCEDAYLAGTDEDLYFKVVSKDNVEKEYYYETTDDIERGENKSFTLYTSADFGEISKFGIYVDGGDDFELDSIEFDGVTYELDGLVLNDDDGYYYINVDNSGVTKVNVGTILSASTVTWSIISTIAILEVGAAIALVVYFNKMKKKQKDNTKEEK